MTTETTIIHSLVQQGIDSGQTEIILSANQFPCFMEPSADGERGLKQTLLTDHGPVSNNEIANYLNDLGVELVGGDANFMLNREDPRVRVSAFSDSMGRLSIVFRVIPVFPTKSIEAATLKLLQSRQVGVDSISDMTIISAVNPTEGNQ